jgi:hypothetical protein
MMQSASHARARPTTTPIELLEKSGGFMIRFAAGPTPETGEIDPE